MAAVVPVAVVMPASVHVFPHYGAPQRGVDADAAGTERPARGRPAPPGRGLPAHGTRHRHRGRGARPRGAPAAPHALLGSEGLHDDSRRLRPPGAHASPLHRPALRRHSRGTDVCAQRARDRGRRHRGALHTRRRSATCARGDRGRGAADGGLLVHNDRALLVPAPHRSPRVDRQRPRAHRPSPRGRRLRPAGSARGIDHMTALLLASLGGYGTFLLYTALVLHWRGLGVGPPTPKRVRRRRTPQEWLAQAGLDDVRPREFVSVVAAMFTVGAALTFALSGGVLPALAVGLFVASFPIASFRARRAHRREEARQAWPAMIEEIRLLTGSLGRPVPQALLEVGLRGPPELRPAFADAQREWLLSTDFERAVAVLKAQLADATADAACETLLVAHE